MSKPIVSACIVAFQHESYIRDCIEGAISQVIDGQYEIIIGEDYSKDRTKEICEEYAQKYPQKIRLICNNKNLGMMGNWYNTIKHCTGKYVALCDGDDYWTDPLKLQKQITILNANEEYSGCFHETQQVFCDGKRGKIYGRDANSILHTEDTISTLAPFHTSSFIFRNIIKGLPEWFSSIVSIDMALFSIVSSYGALIKIPGIMSVCRKHDGGITSQSEVIQQYHSKRIELMKYLNEYHKYKYNSKAVHVIQYHEYFMKEELQEKYKDNTFLDPQLKVENMDLFFIRKSILNFIKENLDKFNGILLDLGCGKMPYKPLLTAHPSRVDRYIGVDIENPAYQQESMPDLFWDGNRIPLENNSVDCVLATELFEHVPDLTIVLKEINRILKPAGSLFFTVPFLWPLHDVPYDEYRYTPFSLERIFKNNNFTDIKLKALGGWNASLAQMIGLWLRRSPLLPKQREDFGVQFFPFYKLLCESDVIPTAFNESTMITGICGTLRKGVQFSN